jgi:hypothetical protein
MLKRQLTERSTESCLSDADDFLIKEERASANEIAELKRQIASKEQKLKHCITNPIKEDHSEVESKLVNVFDCKENKVKEQCSNYINLKEIEQSLMEVVDLFNARKSNTDTNTLKQIKDIILLIKNLVADNKSQIKKLQDELKEAIEVNKELNGRLDAYQTYSSFNTEPTKAKRLSIQEVKDVVKEIVGNSSTKAANSRQIDYFTTSKSYSSSMVTGASDKEALNAYRTLRDQVQYNELLEKYLTLKKDVLKPETIRELFCTNSFIETTINKYPNKKRCKVTDENKLEVLISTFVSNVKEFVKMFVDNEVKVSRRSKSMSREPQGMKVEVKARKLKADIEIMKQEIYLLKSNSSKVKVRHYT